MAAAVACTSALSAIRAGANPNQLSAKASYAPSRLSTRQLMRPAQQQQSSLRSSVVAAAAASSTAAIVVQGRNVEVTPTIKAYVEEKVSKAIANVEGAVKSVDVKLSVHAKDRSTKAHHQRNQKVEITVFVMRFGVVRVEDVEDDLYAAVDLVTDKLKRKLTKLRERAIQKNQWPGRGGTKGGDKIEDHLPNIPPEEPALAPDAKAVLALDDIVREKLLLLAPMSKEEAIEQIEQVGHDFFVFQDSADNFIKVLYRRKTNGFGLIIPQAD